MRGMFGLVSVLVTVGVIVWVMSIYLDSQKGITGPASTGLNKAQQIAGVQQKGIAGINNPGMRVGDDITLDEVMSGSRLRGVSVTTLVQGGPMQTHFGLAPGDLIIEVNGMKIGDISIGDPELAKAQVLEAFQRSQTLTVDRNGQKLVLPLPAGTTPPPMGP